MKFVDDAVVEDRKFKQCPNEVKFFWRDDSGYYIIILARHKAIKFSTNQHSARPYQPFPSLDHNIDVFCHHPHDTELLRSPRIMCADLARFWPVFIPRPTRGVMSNVYNVQFNPEPAWSNIYQALQSEYLTLYIPHTDFQAYPKLECPSTGTIDPNRLTVFFFRRRTLEEPGKSLEPSSYCKEPSQTSLLNNTSYKGVDMMCVPHVTFLS